MRRLDPMKRALFALLLVFLFSCATPEQKAAHDALTAAYVRAHEDGVITPEEIEELKALSEMYAEELGGTDWQELLFTALGATLASFVGVNTYRNRSLPGTKRLAPS